MFAVRLALLSIVRSHPAIATGCAWTIGYPEINRLGSLAEQTSSHVRQIFPDKDVNFPYTIPISSGLIGLNSGFFRKVSRVSAPRHETGSKDLLFG